MSTAALSSYLFAGYYVGIHNFNITFTCQNAVNQSKKNVAKYFNTDFLGGGSAKVNPVCDVPRKVSLAFVKATFLCLHYISKIVIIISDSEYTQWLNSLSL